MSRPFATVKPNALSSEAQAALANLGENFVRLPKKLEAMALDLEVCGLVEVRTEWVWSRGNPGAGYHRTVWRRVPAA